LWGAARRIVQGVPGRSKSSRSANRAPMPPGYWTLWTTVVVDMIGFGVIAPVLGAYAKRFGASPFTTGLLVSSFSLMQFICSPLLGRLSDRIGRKPVIVVTLVGSALSALMFGFATSMWMLFASRMVNGASGSSVAVAMGAVGDIAEPEDRPRLLGLLAAAFGVGFVIGPAIGGLAAYGGPRVPFFVSGAIAGINAIAAWIRLPETHGRQEKRKFALPSGPARQVLVGLLVVFFIQVLAFASIEGLLSRFLLDRFGLGEKGSSFVFAAVGIGLTIIQVGFISRVTTKFGSARLLSVSLLVLAVGLGLLSFATTWLMLAISLAIVVVGSGFFGPSIASLVTGQTDHTNRGSIVGIQQSVGALARIAGPALAGKLLGIKLGLPYLVSGGLVLAAAVVAMRVGGRAAGTAGQTAPADASARFVH
jgi:MFS transporter, DHA1 family, tetracycline resistance protein